MGTIIVIICGLLGVLIGLIFPIYSIIKAANNEELSGGQKAFWLLFILITWIFGSIVYGIVHSGSGFHKLQTALATIFMFVVVGFLIWAIGLGKGEAESTLAKLKANQATLESTLSSDQYKMLIFSYEVLNNEIKRTSLIEITTLIPLLKLSELPAKHFKDHIYTQQEFNEWMKYLNQVVDIEKIQN